MMNRLFAYLTLGACTLSACIGCSPPDTVESLQAKIQRKCEGIRSLRATTSSFRDVWGSETKEEGLLECVRKGGKVLRRVEAKCTSGPKYGRKTESTLLTVLDEQYGYTLSSNGDKVATKVKLDSWSDPICSACRFDEISKRFDFTILPDEKVSGARVWVIEMVPRFVPPGGLMVAGPDHFTIAIPGVVKITDYFDQDTGLLVKQVVIDKNGKTLASGMITDVEVNLDISPERFVFDPPAGVQVRDLTRRKLP